MAVPLQWSTLDQAARWLSEKTREEWTPDRIINFSINQCRPNDIVEDYKYPTYLRTIFPKTMLNSLVWVSIRLENSPLIWVYDQIQLKDKKIATTFLFKDNLVELKSSGKTAIHYISADDHLHDALIAENKNNFLQLSEGEAEPIRVYLTWFNETGQSS